jgi:tRNA-modifying protein YgfZ
MQHRGTARTRIVTVNAESPLPAFGTDILAGGKPAGSMGSSSGTKGLAALRLDRVHDALEADGLVMAGAQVVTVTLQSWVRFGWPES